MASKDELLKMRSDAKKTVAGFVATATASCAVPIPVADAVMLVGEQVTMMTAVSAIYKLGVTKKTLQTLVMGALGASGASVVGKTIVSSAFKLIPGMGTVVGSVISASTAGALTLALGNAFIELCEAVKNGELTEKDLEGKNGKDYFKKLFDKSKNEKEVTEMEFEKPEGQGFIDIHKMKEVVKDGEWGKLIWDEGLLWHEITFYVEETQKSESLAKLLSQKEAIKKFDELYQKYEPSEAQRKRRDEFLKKEKGLDKLEITILGLNKLKDIEPRNRINLEIHCNDGLIGYVEVVSNSKSKLTMKEISIKEEFRGKGICSEVIKRVQNLYDVELSEEVLGEKERLDKA